MTASDKLRELIARNKPFPVSGRMIRDPFVRAFYFGQWKRENRAICEANGWGRDCEGREVTYALAEADYEAAEKEHRKAIQGLWDSRRLERLTAEYAA